MRNDSRKNEFIYNFLYIYFHKQKKIYNNEK